jgi:hypothetical protein
MFDSFSLHLALPFYGGLVNWLAPRPAWESFISYYSYMNFSTKIHVNPCESVSKSLCFLCNLWQDCFNLFQIMVKSAKSADIFMQNKPKLQKTEITLSLYMANGYVSLSAKSADKNKAKTKPNKAKSNPILTPLEQKQSQSNPNADRHGLRHKPNL